MHGSNLDAKMTMTLYTESCLKINKLTHYEYETGIGFHVSYA